MIRVMLADDHAIVRAGLRELLTDHADIEVIAEARNGHEVLAGARVGGFDVLVLDMSMPGRSGIELIKLVKAERPALKVLVLSMYSEEQYAVRAIKAGASGYLNKDSAADELVAAIRRLAAGGAYVSPEVAEQLVLQSNIGDGAPGHRKLSDREFEIFRMIVAGRSLTDIATDLHLSIKTISTHKSHILEKLHVSSHAALVRYALEHGLTERDAQ